MGDGEDHFDEGGAGVVRVRFEKTADGRFRGTLQHTDAAGRRRRQRSSDLETRMSTITATHQELDARSHGIAVQASQPPFE
jgi:hypothetical protein